MEGEEVPPREFDLCGLRCPLPVLRARRLLKSLEAGVVADFLVDDPKAPDDFAALARATGWRLLILEEATPEAHAPRWRLRLAQPPAP